VGLMRSSKKEEKQVEKIHQFLDVLEYGYLKGIITEKFIKDPEISGYIARHRHQIVERFKDTKNYKKEIENFLKIEAKKISSIRERDADFVRNAIDRMTHGGKYQTLKTLLELSSDNIVTHQTQLRLHFIETAHSERELKEALADLKANPDVSELTLKKILAENFIKSSLTLYEIPNLSSDAMQLVITKALEKMTAPLVDTDRFSEELRAVLHETDRRITAALTEKNIKENKEANRLFNQAYPEEIEELREKIEDIQKELAALNINIVNPSKKQNNNFYVLHDVLAEQISALKKLEENYQERSHQLNSTQRENLINQRKNIETRVQKAIETAQMAEKSKEFKSGGMGLFSTKEKPNHDFLALLERASQKSSKRFTK